MSESNKDCNPQQKKRDQLRINLRVARQLIGAEISSSLLHSLKLLSTDFSFSLPNGDLQLVNNSWYVTHLGLLRLARRKKCVGMHVETVSALCDSSERRYVVRATVYPTKNSSGFFGYGDADPSNVSSIVRGAELRIAETRALNRALRKAYGIGICSVDEIGSRAEPASAKLLKSKMPPQPQNGHGNCSVRDRLCQIIRHHQLDPNLVKSYATDYCSVKTLREASREQVENFVAHLADWAEKDRNALLCQLNSYLDQKEGAA
jgi:hypothetical protein